MEVTNHLEKYIYPYMFNREPLNLKWSDIMQICVCIYIYNYNEQFISSKYKIQSVSPPAEKKYKLIFQTTELQHTLTLSLGIILLHFTSTK